MTKTKTKYKREHPHNKKGLTYDPVRTEAYDEYQNKAKARYDRLCGPVTVTKKES
jgi:hypothetical protein